MMFVLPTQSRTTSMVLLFEFSTRPPDSEHKGDWHSGWLPAYFLNGIVKQKVEPLPFLDSTHICPPWASTRIRHTLSPSPMPWMLFFTITSRRWNFWKSRSWSSGDMPNPWSLIQTTRFPFSCLAEIFTSPPWGWRYRSGCTGPVLPGAGQHR